MKNVVKKALALVLAGALAFAGSQASVAAASSPTTVTREPAAQESVTASAMSSGVTPTVNTSSKGIATVYSVKKTTDTTVTINSTVKVDGVKYTVTCIQANAFKNATKAEKIVIPATITAVKASAFSKLAKTVTTLQFNNTTAPSVNKNAFKGTSTKNMTIKVSKKMSKTELKKFKKRLTKAGFKGTVTQ